MALLAVYGAGGAGRGIVPLVRMQAEADDSVCFIDDGQGGAQINGLPAYSFSDFLELPGPKSVAIAIANPELRARIATKCIDAGLAFFQVRAGDVVEMDEVEIGEGAILSPSVILTSNIRIGKHFHANLQSYVEHDCVIGDFVTFAPTVRCNGNVTIGDHAYIGCNAVIKQGLTIGAGAVIGMGAVVTKDVPAGETWVGNPAKKLEKSK